MGADISELKKRGKNRSFHEEKKSLRNEINASGVSIANLLFILNYINKYHMIDFKSHLKTAKDSFSDEEKMSVSLLAPLNFQNP